MKFKAYDIVKVLGKGEGMVMGTRDNNEYLIIYADQRHRKKWEPEEIITLTRSYNGEQTEETSD